MSTLQEVGASYIASLLFPQEWYIGWGEGAVWWDSNQTEVFEFTANSATLTRQNISAVVVKTLDDVTTFDSGDDYTVNLETGVITRNPAGDMANDTDYRVFYYANRPDPANNQNALVSVLGLMQATVVEYVEVDEEGALSTGDDQNWTISVTPTPYIYVEAEYDYLDESDAIIKEIALFVNPTLEDDLPPEQTYFPPADYTDIGTILNIENIAPVVRSVSNRGKFKTVLRLVDAG